MIAEIIPEAYDPAGHKVFRPDLRRHGIHPTFPMGRYVSQPLTVKCETIRDIRKFLSGCKGVSDMEQFGKLDYWQPPEHFEQTRKGDCEDFALWTWRQFLTLGYNARVVFGRQGRYGIGHAWVEFLTDDGRCFLVEPQYWPIGEHMPRLSTLAYHPKISASWDGDKITFYQHEDRHLQPRLSQLLPLVSEWLLVWIPFWLWNLPRLPVRLWRRLHNL
jgi:hypothetical protein